MKESYKGVRETVRTVESASAASSLIRRLTWKVVELTDPERLCAKFWVFVEYEKVGFGCDDEFEEDGGCVMGVVLRR